MQKYIACNIRFPCSRKWQTLRRLFNTFVSKTVSANFDIFPGLFFYARLTLERTGKTKNADTVFEPYYIGTFSPNLSQNGSSSMHTNLKRAPNFLKMLFREKEQNSFRDVLPVKQQGVKVITCGWQANGSAYFITIALKHCSAREFNAIAVHVGSEGKLLL